jgi:hypothetical protein
MSEPAGLCATCIHARRVPHPRGEGAYWRCLLADTDPRFAKYPRLPVLRCSGYEKVAEKKQG